MEGKGGRWGRRAGLKARLGALGTGRAESAFTAAQYWTGFPRVRWAMGARAPLLEFRAREQAGGVPLGCQITALRTTQEAPWP